MTENKKQLRPACNCWISDDGLLGPHQVGGNARMYVKVGELFNAGDPIGEVNGKKILAPYYATVEEINPDVGVVPITTDNWLIKVKDINPTYSCYFAPPLEVLGDREPPISGTELYRRIRKNMNLPGKECKNIAEVVEYLCRTNNSKLAK